MKIKRILISIVVVAFVQLVLYNYTFLKKNSEPIQSTQTEVYVPATFPSDLNNNSFLVIPVLVLAYNRPSVDRCIKSILDARPSSSTFPLIVSQDGDDHNTEVAIRAFPQVYYMRQTNQTDYPLPKKKRKLQGYFHLSRHYKWALNKIFMEHNFTTCIIIEDDLEVSKDFFEYMLATHALLSSDPSLYCVSAWNDNGKPELVDGEKSGLIHRTDFFPGLGWMLTKELWMEMEPQWPDAFWDDWMRTPEVRKERSCLRPEISRTMNFGLKGVSNGLHFKTFLGKIQKFDGFVPFTKLPLDYLALESYNEEFLWRVYSTKLTQFAPLIEAINATNGVDPDKYSDSSAYRVLYSNCKEFVKIAKAFGIMSDHKSGIPRTAYRGIVPIRFGGKSIYIAPIYDWRGYDPSCK